MDSGTKTSTFEFSKDKDYEDYKDFFLRVTENEEINVWKEFLDFCSSFCNWMEDFLEKVDKYTAEIDEVMTNFLDFWAIAGCWLKERFGLTVEDGEDNEDQALIEDGGDQEGDGDQRCMKKKEIGRGAVRMREGRPKHGLVRGDGGDEDEDEEMVYEGEDEEARKVRVAEVTMGTVKKQEEVGEEMHSKEEDPDKGKHGSDRRKRSLSNQQFENKLEKVENVTYEEEGGKNKKPRLDVCEEAGFEGEGEVVPRQGEESGEGRLTREDLDRLFEDSDDEIERESVGRGKRRRRGF